MLRSASLFLAGSLVASAVACGGSSDVEFGDPGNDTTSGGPPVNGASSSSGGGIRADGGSGGPSTPAHCGDPGAPKCNDGEACRTDADCTSVTCTGALCVAPSPTDGKKNADETDVDCGGAVAPKCGVGKGCGADSDCTTEACPSSKKCMSSRSCRRHFGGETCGAGEVDTPGAAHEDCCLSIQPGTKDYRVDKYLVTAGRMRAFVEEVALEFGGQPNVKAWVAAHPDRVPNWNDDWNDSLPSSSGDIVRLIGTGQNPGAGWGSQGQANGCYVQSGGAPTFWHSKDALLAQSGDMERSFSQDQLDVKVLNCTPAALFAAFCAYDGGRLATSAEWKYAVRGDQTEAQRLFPWGNPVGANKAAVDAEIKLHAAYDKNYQFPAAPVGVPLAEDGLPIDRGFEVAAPGRFPLGAGPFGHADLLGVVETMVLDSAKFTMIRQYAFQEAYYGVQDYGRLIQQNSYTSHYAVGARCSRPL